MKKTLYVAFLLGSFMYACVQAQTTKNTDQITEVEQSKTSESDDYWEQDSLKKLNTVNEIIKHITTNKHKNHIEKSYKEEDPSYKGRMTFNSYYCYGNIFSKHHKHLYIKIGSQYETQYQVYLLKDNTCKQQIFYKESNNTLIGDTIIDRNGDGFKDLDIEWYAMAGCCLREAHEVYLCKPDGTFTNNYRFINPTFNTKSKIIRGVDYGHPGQTPLYKYKWNGFNAVDTIEYIYPNPKDTINYSFIKVKSWKQFEELSDSDNNSSFFILKDLPAEYLNPQNLKEDYLDWFLWYNPNNFIE